MASVQLLSVESISGSPCTVITTENGRFMFDVGEGTQRLAIEHRVRLGKLEGIFLTRLCPETVCGLPGMVLTAADAGCIGFNVVGPCGTKGFWQSTRFFMRRPSFMMELMECSSQSLGNSTSSRSTKAPGKKSNNVVYAPEARQGSMCIEYEDGAVHAIPYKSHCNAEQESSHVCYIFETPQLPGKFDVKKALALGLKPGPVFGKLKNGESVQMEDGTTIEPRQVLDAAVPGRYVAVICNAMTQGGDNTLLDQIVRDSYWALFKKSGQGQPGGLLADRLDAVVHLSPGKITSTPSYRLWLHSLGHDSTHHLMSGQDNCVPESSFVAATCYTNKLHALFPHMYSHLRLRDEPAPNPGVHQEQEQEQEAMVFAGEPLLNYTITPVKRKGLTRCPTNPVELDREVSAWLEGLVSGSEGEGEGEDSAGSSSSTHALGLQKAMARIVSLCEGNSESDGQVESPGGKGSDSTGGELRRQFCLDSDEAAVMRAFGDYRLWILGTGSAVPSKYRNVTGMMVQIPATSCSPSDDAVSSSGRGCGAGLLLDVGEGTWQQLVRLAHAQPSLLSDDHGDGAALGLAKCIRAIWVSHPHADHHLGITRVLAECKRLLGPTFTPIIVVAPPAVLLYLQEYTVIDPQVRGTYLAVSSRWLEPQPNPSPFPSRAEPTTSSPVRQKFAESESTGQNSAYHLEDNRAIDETANWKGPFSAENLSRAEDVWRAMGIKEMVNVQVDHCRQAYGVSVTLSCPASPDKDCKLVYSGDTRPCEAVSQLGVGASVLIHEATFGDDKSEEAVSKRHSTIGEAVEMGRKIGAFRTLLTHFSQRYPSAPPIPTEGQGQGQGQPVPPVLAFDFMHVTFRDLLWAPATTAVLAMAFPAEGTAEEEEEEEEEAEEKGGGKSNEDRCEERRAVAASPGAFARFRGRRQCACCVGVNDDGEEEDLNMMTTSSRATDKMRRKRKGCLRDLAAASKSRGTKL